MKMFLAFTALFFISIHSYAKIWRVNNNTGILADFTTLQAAINAAAAGDTIMVEPSMTGYGGGTLSKKLTIIGPGYYFTDATPNPKTQDNKNAADIGTLSLKAGSEGTVTEGCKIGSVFLSAGLITLQRNFISSYFYIASDLNSICDNDTIRQNVMYGLVSNNSTGKASNLLVYNNIFNGPPVQFSSNLNNVSGYFINNDFLYGFLFSCTNFSFQNNIFAGPNFGPYLSSNSFFNNITSNSGLPSGNGNQLNIDLNNVFLGFASGTGFSSDGRYKLKAGSPAINAGVLNGEAVDCGAFGGPASYVLSGMPPVPSIYLLDVPESVPTGASNLNISISATTVH